MGLSLLCSVFAATCVAVTVTAPQILSSPGVPGFRYQAPVTSFDSYAAYPAVVTSTAPVNETFCERRTTMFISSTSPLPSWPSVVVALCLLEATASAEEFDIHSFGVTHVSWGELNKRAGYLTEDGKWNGGLPRTERSTSIVDYGCKDDVKDGQFCTLWARDAKNSTGHLEARVCNCTTTKNETCRAWSCKHVEPQPGDRDHKGCRCIPKPEKADDFCSSWTCVEDLDRKVKLERAEFTCRDTHKTSNHCSVWTGEIESDKNAESWLCACQHTRTQDCEKWTCEIRDLPRCKGHKTWCRPGIAIGLFGVLGLLYLLGGFAVIFHDFVDVFLLDHRDETVEAETYFPELLGMFISYCLFFVFPWCIGVAIVGGTDALWINAIMWGAAFCFLAAVIAATFLVATVRRHDIDDRGPLLPQT